MLPLQLQAESHIPLYVQLCDQLRALVHAGELRPGDRIPASRELAQHLGVPDRQPKIIDGREKTLECQRPGLLPSLCSIETVHPFVPTWVA